MGNLARRIEREYEQAPQIKTRKVIKKGRLTTIEKLLGIVFCIALFIAGVNLVTYQASIYEVNKEIQLLNTKIEEQEKINIELADQVSEQSTYERVWRMAIQSGLMLDKSNVKVVQE